MQSWTFIEMELKLGIKQCSWKFNFWNNSRKTLSTEDNAKLSKLLTEGFKRSVYWNKYKAIIEQRYNANDNIRTLIDPSWQRINRLFVLAYLNDANSTVDSHRKYFLTRVKIENYNTEIDGRNFYD